MSIQSRQPPGIPVGGQFATTQRGETDLSLTPVAGTPDWGTISVGEGSRTPWGEAQYATEWAPGIVSVGCAGHGGVKLSPERNKEVPAPLRNANGWYEEDAEAYIIGMIHADAHNFPTLPIEDSQSECEARVREYFPDGYEQATGTLIPFGESAEKDARTYRAQARYVLGSKTYVDSDGVTCRELLDQFRDHAPVWVMMTDEEAQRYTAAVPEKFGAAPRYRLPALLPDAAWSNHAMVDDPRPKLASFSRLPNADNASASARARVAKDLAKRFRGEDGKVRSLGDVIETEGMTGKSVTVENGSRKYYLQQHTDPADPSSAYTPWQVSKETWERFGAPDTRTERDLAREEVSIARSKMERLNSKASAQFRRSKSDQDALLAAKAKYDAARANLQLHEEDSNQ